MKRMMQTTLFLLACFLTTAPLSVHASENMGIVDDVQTKKGAIVVDDRWYPLAPGFRVHGSPDGKLEKKMKIAFTTSDEGSGSEMITEVWVLPANFEIPDDN